MNTSKVIKIQGLTDVYNFIAEATKVDGDVIIKRGRFVVDAKSVMGVFSIDMSNAVTVTYPAGAIEFDQYLNNFIVTSTED